MNKKSKIFSLGLMILFLSMPLYMSYLPASQELGIYFQDTPGIRGFFLWIPQWLVWAGLGQQAASKLYLFIMNVLTCLISYGCFDKMVSGKVSALAGSICYSFSVYSIYIRYDAGSMGEMAAYAMLPLCLYGFYGVYTSQQRQGIWKGIGWMMAGGVGLIYAHIPVALIVLAFLILGCILMGKKSLQRMRPLVLTMGLGGSVLLGLPVLVPYMQAVSNGIFYIHDNELFTGRGLEIAELLTAFPVKVTAMEGNIIEGMVSYVPLGLPAVVSLVVYVAGVCLGATSTDDRKGKIKLMKRLLIIVGVSIMLSFRIFPWNTLLARLPGSVGGGIRTGLEHIGYPHRFLLIAILLLAFLATLLGQRVEEWATEKHGEHKELILGAFLGIVIALNVFSGVYYMNNLLYMMPMEDSITAIRDSWWLESEYLLYISK
ncbi:MAG: hypothetical protein IKV27_00790 [Lachnospiraceae bacterium]|nr:hypothetical protein [Lachnospiraceae bacterium]